MNLRPYGKYKDSPIDWADRLPAHWGAVSLRWVSMRYSGGTPDKGNDAYWEEGEIPWLNSGAVNDAYITRPSALITREGFANSSAKWIPKKSLVMALAGQGKTKGMVAQVGIDTTCNQSMAAIIPDTRFSPRYLYWWLTANYQNIRNIAGGDARDGLNLDLIGSIGCPVPTMVEQDQISRHLDLRVTEIERLILKKRDFIVRLNEKRIALIAKVMICGLPSAVAKKTWLESSAEMKDSEVDWIGKVPKEWSVLPLKRVARFVEGPGIMAADFLGEGVPLIRISGLSGKYASLDGANYLDPVLVSQRWEHFKTKVGDLLISGSASTGMCCEIDSVAEGAVPYTGIIIIRGVAGKANNHFLRWYFQSAPFLSQVSLMKTGSTIQHFGPSHLSRMVISIPRNLQEQKAAAEFLDVETLKLDFLIQKTNSAIESLIAYRQAMISAAVTGKIDIRKEA